MKNLLIILISVLVVNIAKSQCTAPTFTVNLSAAADTSYTLKNQTRGGVCCVGSSTVVSSSNCVSFLVYLNPNTELISFDVSNPSPSGSAYYQVNCGTPVSIGTPLCAVGLVSPFTITYCKPGGDSPDYLISAGTIVKGSNDISIQKTGCVDTLFVSNVNIASIVWNSIYPGTLGQYNNYLSCTAGCNSTLVTPIGTPPPYVDFEVSGMPNTSCGSFSRDTIRVYFVPRMTGTVTPATPVICSASGTSVTFTANISGGAVPYKYDWSQDPGPNNAQTSTVSSAGTYTVVVTDNTKCPPLTLTKTIATIPATTFSYSSSSFCKNLTNPAPVFIGYGQPGVFSATPAGLSFVSTSTGVINLAASATGTYVVTNTISPSGTCPGSSATTTVSIYSFPTMTSASTASICSGGVVNIPLTASSSSKFSWYATDNVNTIGESITTQTTTSLTNTLTNSAAVNEVVIYTVTPTSLLTGSCVGTPQTVSVTVRPKDDATFNYPSSTNCQTGTNPVATITGLAGGTFSAGPGIVFTGTVGTINLSASSIGSYTVTYTTNGLCPNTHTFPINITTAPLAGFSFTSSPYCQSSANPFPTFSVNASGGTFSSTGALVFANNLTGEIDLPGSPAGTYTITNTIAPSGLCGASTASAIVTITQLKEAGFSYTASPICQTSANPLPTFTTSGVAGTFTSTAGLNINSASGLVNLTGSTPGTYTVSNTLAANGGCPVVTATTNITITGLPIATFNYSATPFCSTSANQAPTYSGGGVAGLFSPSSVYLDVDANTGLIDISNSLPGDYVVANTIASAGGCPAVVANASVTITELPDAAIAYSGPYCSNSSNPTPSLSVNGTNGVYSSSPAGLTIDTNAGTINLSTSAAGTYTVTNTVAAANGCPLVAGTSSLTITQLPVASFNYSSTPYCINGSNPLPTFTGGGVAGTFSATAGASVAPTTGLVNLSGSSAGTYTVTNFIAAANGCADVISTNTITINPVATANAASDATICASGSYTLGGNIGGAASTLSWTTSGSGSFSSATLANAVYSPSPADISAGSVVLTIRTDDPAGPCSFATDAMTLTINPTPTVSAGPTNTLTCSNTTLSLSGSGGGSYAWSGPGIISGSNTATPVINTPGTYSLVVTSGSGCPSNVSTVAISQNTTAPTVASSSTGSLSCTTLSVNVTATTSATPVSYNWSGTGITSAANISTITVNQGGTFNYTVTNTFNNCKTTGSQAVVQNTTAPIVTSANTGSLSCTTLSVNVTATTSASPVTYNWSGTGITSATNISTITVNQGGTFNYTVTNTSNNCATTGSQAVIQNTTAPTVASANTGSLSCSTLSVNVTATTSATPVSYNWSGTGITSATNISTITVNQGGTFNYTVTNTSNNCKATGSQAVVQNTIAPTVASANTGSLNCTITSVNASASTSITPVSYNWSGTGITSATNISTITVNQGGTFNYTVTNTSNNCKTTGSQAVTQNTTAPLTTASTTGSVTCTTNTINLNSTLAGMNYTWTAPSGSSILSGSTLQNAIGQGLGTYSVNVLDPFNNCTYSTTTSAIQNTTTPTGVSAGSNQSLICGVPSVTLSGTSTPTNSTIDWLGGVCGSATSLTTTACAPGTYTMNAAHPITGCIVSSTVAVVSSTDIPQATVNPVTNSITCTNSLVTVGVTLSNSDPVTYAWSGPGISGASNTAVITTTIGGTYSVVITNTVTNCQAIYNSAVPTKTNPVTVNISPAFSVTCSSPTITLNVSPVGAQFTYTWSGNGIISGGTTANPVVDAGGDFSVTVTNINSGCMGTSTVTVPSNTVIPVVSIAVPSITTTCTDPTTTLSIVPTPSIDVVYSWTVPSTGALDDNTISNPVASGSGIFTVAVTNTISGCTSSQYTVEVFWDNVIPTTTLSTSSVSITCSVPTPSVDLTTSTGSASYSWSPASGIVSGTENTSTPSFSLPGTYSAVVTNTVSGCATSSSVNEVTVSLDNTIPVISITGAANDGTITCTTTSITVSPTITPNSNLTYSWTSGSGSGIAGATDQSTATFTAAGTYTLAITNTVTGCVSVQDASAIFTVYENTVSPTVLIASPSITTTCADPTATLSIVASPSVDVTYAWTAPVTGALDSYTVSNPVASGSGIFTVVVTNTVSGCMSSSITQSTIEVIPDVGIPTTTLSASSLSITCAVPTPSVNLSTTTGNATYNWSPVSGIVSGTENTSTPSFSLPGTYSVVVTNTVSGCATSGNFDIVTVSLDNTIPIINITGAVNDGTITCTTTSIAVSPTITPNSNLTYSWTSGSGSGILGATDQSSATFTAAGSYTLAITNTVTGCVSVQDASAIFTVYENTVAPTVLISTPSVTTTCANPSTTLSVVATPSTDVTYAWTAPSTGALDSYTVSNPVASGSGIFTVVVTNSVSGCSSSSVSQSTISVTPDTGIPTTTLSANTLSITCANPTPSVTVISNTGTVSYSWTPTSGIVSGTENTASPSFSLAGTYSAVVTNTVSGCATFISNNVVTVISDVTIPTVAITASSNSGTLTCLTTSISVTPTIIPTSGLTYTWTSVNGSGIAGSANQASATFTAADVYTLAVTNTVTGCSSAADASSTFTVYVDNTVPVSAFKFATSCSNDSVRFTDQSSIASGTITNWNWTFGDGHSSTLQNPANAYAAISSYTVSLQVQASNGCVSTSSAVVNLIPTVVADYIPHGGEYLVNQPISFTNQSSGANSYSWTFGDGVTETSSDPSHVFTTTGTYPVMLIVTNGVCEDSVVYLFEIKPSGYAIPGGFTPNNDGLNDGFSVLGGPFENYELRVFNAWGNQVFMSVLQDEKWDGTYKGTPQPAGTYIYIFNGKIVDGEELKLKGEVHIIR